MAEERTRQQLWGEILPDPEKCLKWKIVGCTFYARRVDDEWMFSYEHERPDCVGGTGVESSVVAQPAGCPEELPWTRFVTVRNDRVDLTPSLPDRPLVVRPEAAITILSDRFGQFFLSIPVWFRFVAHPDGREVTMLEIPSVVLSNIWFGDPAAGELCYSLDAHMERDARSLGPLNFRAICPLLIRNNSREQLNVQRICVHVAHLSLYLDREGLWTNEVYVQFKGSDQISQLSYANGPPSFAPDARSIAGPRTPADSSLLKRSFSFLRQISGM